jgi:AbrB family looped-hinge helix DNA binding protein
MALVSVKSKYQVVIPRDVREAAGVEVGDLLEAKVEAGKITLTPKPAVDHGVAESLADFAAGRSYGPFKTAKDLVDSLHRESARIRPKAKSKRKPRK